MSTLGGEIRVASPDPIEQRRPSKSMAADRDGSTSAVRTGTEVGSQPILMVDTAFVHRHPRSSGDSGRASTSLDPLDAESMLPPQAILSKGNRRRSNNSYGSQDGPMSAASQSGMPSSARYVTVSSILSRSGAVMPLGELAEALIMQDIQGMETSSKRAENSGGRSPVLTQKNKVGSKRASNGSALEALGALFLQQDSSGKVSNLSFLRHNVGNVEGKPGKERRILSSLSRSIAGGATRLGIRMPKQDDAGETIAQRRARKMGNGNHNGVRIQSTKRNEPTFEVTVAHPTYPSIPSPLDDETPPPAPRLKGAGKNGMTPPHIESDFDMDMERTGKPRTFLQAPLTAPSAVYGPGSAFSWIEPPELPPSPIGMPGAWLLGRDGWNSDRMEEGALLLPPPLLDDQGSDPKSFEGLLGIRRMREQERARKQLDKLKARNRPAHKIGMLTAFSNFVKAAHAADRATRAATNARPRMPLQRRHTEPAVEHVERDTDGITADDAAGLVDEVESMPLDPVASTSLDSTGRQLDTVYETSAASFDQHMQDEDRDDDAISDIDALEGYDDIDEGADLALSSSLHSEGRSSFSKIRLPIRIASREDVRSAVSTRRSSIDSDRRLGRSSGSGGADPLTPRIGPTMLSLPPSPWTPYGASSRSGTQTPFFVQLGMTPALSALPGTPRLIPALLEVLSAPSPFPTNAGMTPLIRSPRMLSSRTMPVASTDFIHNFSAAPSPLALSPRESPILSSTSPRPPSIRRRRTVATTGDREDQRLTPLASMAMKQDQPGLKPPRTRRRSSVGKPGSVSKAPPARKRSFLLWFLIGDLGLGTRRNIAAKADGSPVTPAISTPYSSAYLGFVAVAAHLYGFTVFLLAHLVDLAYRIAEFLSTVFWFTRWMTLNITGQTVLARCVIDAYNLVSREWETVSKEDHEGKADDVDSEGKPTRRTGLTKWQVLKGLLELFCLQDVTREQYLKEGAGLQELVGWRKRRNTIDGPSEQLDLGAMRAADRKAKADVVERDAKAQNSDNDESDDDDDDDDEMVVTRRGPDILEFTKTPRVEHGQYFSSFSDDGDAGEEGKRRQPSLHSNGRGSSNAGAKTTALLHDADARQMVKTIKWASRLAISAYGLHVTLVDLPATFTPSGDRFSRQTFAHLSRLHHEDVLHADIQTLDSADYSPTFYLVRDYTRRCVAVSVRGTQSLQDIIVDLDLMVDQVKLPNKDMENDDEDDAEPLYCHAGILRAAQALIDRDSTLFRTLRDALNEHPDFSVVFTGHSLGGAIASAVVLLLSRYQTWDGSSAAPPPGAQDGSGRWVTHDRSGLPAGRAIRAIAFAHPATFNAKLASRAATGRTPLVLSVVLGHDIIPRCGHGQARELRRVLGALSRVRRRKEPAGRSRRNSIVGSVVPSAAYESKNTGSASAAGEDDARVHVFTSWRAWRAIKRKGGLATAQEQGRAKRIEEQLWRLRCDVEGDLYSAVKRRSQEAGEVAAAARGQGHADPDVAGTAKRNAPTSIPPSPWIGPWQHASVPLHQLAARRQALDAVTLANEESISQAAGVLVPAGLSIWLHQGRLYTITSPLSFFSLPDFHPRMFSEHFPSAYEDWLEKL